MTQVAAEVAVAPAVAVAVAQTSQKKEYKGTMSLRVSKAAASIRCRKRKQWLADNPTLTAADLPAELRKAENYQKGRRTTDTSDMTDEEIAQLERTRVSKAQASRECNARKRWRKAWMAANDGAEPTEADMPEELRIVRKAKAATEEAIEAEAPTTLEVEAEAEVAAEEPATKPKRQSRAKAKVKA